MMRAHASDIAAIDLVIVPTIGFDLLYGRKVRHPWIGGPRLLTMAAKTIWRAQFSTQSFL
jgi:hypothetical protein